MADKKNDGIDLFSAANVPPKKTTAQTGVFRVPDIVDPNDLIEIDEDEDKRLSVLSNSVTLQELVDGLNALGIGPRDMISILQAIKAAGALQAEIELL